MKRFNRLALLLLLTASLLSYGFDSCSNSRQRNIAFARDVVNSLQSALPLVRTLNSRVGEELARAIPIAQRVVTAIEQSDAQIAIALLNDLLPIINNTVAEFTGNVQVLTILALADIALHFLINHFQPQIEKLAKQSTRAAGSPIVEYSRQPVWGCQYRPDLCK